MKRADSQNNHPVPTWCASSTALYTIFWSAVNFPLAGNVVVMSAASRRGSRQGVGGKRSQEDGRIWYNRDVFETRREWHGRCLSSGASEALGVGWHQAQETSAWLWERACL